MSTVHLHHGIGHRSVIMMGSGNEGGDGLLIEAEEALIDEEEEVIKKFILKSLYFNIYIYIYTTWKGKY